jgi:FkbM family methyltransferase
MNHSNLKQNTQASSYKTNMKALVKKIVGPKLIKTIKKYFIKKKVEEMKTTVELKTIDELDTILRYFSQSPNGKQRTMIDVGVHFGESSSPFLEKGWKVIGIEPDDENIKIIKKKIGENPNFTLVELAVSDKPGELNFYTSEVSSGISSLLNFHDTHKASQVVKVETLNKVLEDHKIESPSFLKIDAEGFDLLVLKGIDLNKFTSIEFIVCEFEDNKTKKLNYTTKDMIEYLIQFGYKIIVSEFEPIVKYGIKHTYKGAQFYPCEINPLGWGNLIAYKDVKYGEKAIKELFKKL